VKGRLPDPDHRRVGDRARRIEARIVEAGDDMRVRALAVGLANTSEHAGHGERLVVKALDRDRPHVRLAGVDDRAGQRD
jgi:hypothetical protein